MNSEIKKRNNKHNWQKIDDYFFSGHSIAECRKRFEFNHATLAYARRSGKSNIPIVSKTLKKNIRPMLRYGEKLNNTWFKKVLIKEGILEYKCYTCSIHEWNNEKLVLQLDHIDGDRKNNVLENLRLLCPNCHSQTPTFCKGMRFRVS